MKSKLVLTLVVVFTITSSQHVISQTNSSVQFISLLENARKANRERQWPQAIEYWQQVVKLNPVNGDYIQQLGDAAYNGAKYEIAIDAYKKQLDSRHGWLYNAAYNIACCYALLGDKKNALEWLKKSIDLGFSNFAHAQKDSDLKSLHGDPEFERTVLAVDVSKMDRLAGWNYDLEVLQKEIDRKAVKAGQFDAAAVRKSISDLRNKIPSLTDNQVYLELIRIMRNLNDGHSWAMPPFESKDFNNSLPVLFYQFNDGLYVIAADPAYKELLGAQVLSYSGIDVSRLPELFEPYISRDNAYGPVTRIPYLMRMPAGFKVMGLIKDDKVIDLKVKDLSGNIKTVPVKADLTEPNIWNTLPSPKGWVNYFETINKPVPLYQKQMNVFHWWEMLPDNKTVYAQINRVRDAQGQTFAQLAERLFKFIDSADADKLVIDLRWNNGGNTMLVQPLINAIIQHPKINQQGKLFVIIGRRTYSAAQNLSTYLERYTKATFVGEPTGSSPNFIGEEEPLILPYSKVPINVSDLYWQASWPGDNRPWIAPMIYTPPSFSYYKDNRDPSLEAIVEFINAKKGF